MITTEELEKLAKFKEKGIISEEEFNSIRDEYFKKNDISKQNTSKANAIKVDSRTLILFAPIIIACIVIYNNRQLPKPVEDFIQEKLEVIEYSGIKNARTDCLKKNLRRKFLEEINTPEYKEISQGGTADHPLDVSTKMMERQTWLLNVFNDVAQECNKLPITIKSW